MVDVQRSPGARRRSLARLSRAAVFATAALALAGCTLEPFPGAAPPPPPAQSEEPDWSPTASPQPEPTEAPPTAPSQAPPPPTQSQAAPPGANGAPEPEIVDEVALFQSQCEQEVEAWRAAQVHYPMEMSVSVGGAASYNAAIDIRSDPLPADQVIDIVSGTARSEDVRVKCTVAAKLTSVGDALVVAQHGNQTDAGWILQQFTPTGVVEWSWTVDALKPGHEQLRLELRPAIVLADDAGDLEYASQSVGSFVTQVHIQASPLQLVAHWFEVNWPLVLSITGALTAASVGFGGIWRKVQALRKGKLVAAAGVGTGAGLHRSRPVRLRRRT